MNKTIFTRLMIGDVWIEKDINDQPRLVMKDELGEEWVLGQDGPYSVIEKKSTSWFFDEKNRHKSLTSFI